MAAPDLHAAACDVPSDARDLILPDRFEYADAFVVTVPPGTRIAAAEWARTMFTPHSLTKHALVGAWNAVMGLEPPAGGSAIGPFQLVSPKREAAILVGNGERYRVRLVVLASDGSLTLATFVQSLGRGWRELLRGILVGHRRVAPLLLARAVGARTGEHQSRRARPRRRRPAVTPRLRVLRGVWRLGNPLVILLARWTAVWGVIETRGRQTGLKRRVPIALTQSGGTVWVVVAQGRNAAYVRNIEADPAVRVRIKGDWLDGVAALEPASTEIPESIGRYARAATLLFPDQYRLLRIDLATASHG